MIIDTAIALCNLEDAKRMLNIEDASKDDLIIQLINAVSEDCQNRYAYRNLIADDFTENYDGDGTNVLFLKHAPLNTVASVILSDSGAALDASTYVLYLAESKIVLKYNVFAVTINEIEIQYNGGYVDIDSLPKELRQSVVDAVAYRFMQSDKKRWGLVTQSMGEQQSTYETSDYPKAITKILDSYNRGGYA